MDTIACPVCDLLQAIPPLLPRAKARCAQCGETLATRHADPFDLPLALTIAAAVTFLIANAMPLMGLSAAGRQATTTIIGGALEMWLQGRPASAAAVAFCAVIAPAAHLLFLLVVLLAIRHPPAPSWIGDMLRGVGLVQPWSMTEVMMLGILVALVKIAQLATVEPGIGAYAAGAFVVLLSAILVTFDPREVWSRIEWADGTIPPPVADSDASGAAQ